MCPDNKSQLVWNSLTPHASSVFTPLIFSSLSLLNRTRTMRCLMICIKTWQWVLLSYSFTSSHRTYLLAWFYPLIGCFFESICVRLLCLKAHDEWVGLDLTDLRLPRVSADWHPELWAKMRLLFSVMFIVANNSNGFCHHPRKISNWDSSKYSASHQSRRLLLCTLNGTHQTARAQMTSGSKNWLLRIPHCLHESNFVR